MKAAASRSNSELGEQAVVAKGQVDGTAERPMAVRGCRSCPGREGKSPLTDSLTFCRLKKKFYYTRTDTIEKDKSGT